MMQKLTHPDALNRIMAFEGEGFSASHAMITLKEAEQVFRRVLALKYEQLDAVLLAICLDDVRDEKLMEAGNSAIQETIENQEE